MLKYVPGSKANARAISQLVDSMLRDSVRAFRRAHSPGIRVKGKSRQLWAGRRTAWLTDKQLKILNRAVNGIVSFMNAANRKSEGKTLYAFSFVLSPYQVGKRENHTIRDGKHKPRPMIRRTANRGSPDEAPIRVTRRHRWTGVA